MSPLKHTTVTDYFVSEGMKTWRFLYDIQVDFQMFIPDGHSLRLREEEFLMQVAQPAQKEVAPNTMGESELKLQFAQNYILFSLIKCFPYIFNN